MSRPPRGAKPARAGTGITPLAARAMQAHQAGQLALAATLYDQHLQARPQDAGSLNRRGVVAAQLGDAKAAQDYISRAIAQNPGAADYHYNLALALAQEAQTAQAMAACRAALALAPSHAGAHYNLANLLAQAGQWAEAIGHYRSTLAAQPGHADALNNLGAALSLTGQTAEAIKSLRAALAVNPGIANAHFNLGKLLQESGALEEALASYATALRLQPQFAEAQSNRGNTLRALGRHQEALFAYTQAIRLAPGLAAAHSNLGATLKTLGRLDEAEAACRKAIALGPGAAAAHTNLASVLQEKGAVAQALAACETALRLAPDDAETHRQHGALLAASNRLTAAEAAYTRALALQPGLAAAQNDLGNLLGDLGRFEEANAAYAAAQALQPDHAYHSNQLMTLYYRESATPQEMLQAAVAFGQRHLAPARSFPNPATTARRLRVGYVSADFRRHPAGYFLAPVLPCHDNIAIEPVCYSNSPLHDDLTAQLRQAVPRWRSIHTVPDGAAADQIRADEIDILVDLSGHSGGNRLPLFALRPAPVQLSWLGFWGTTGLPAMDYILSDAISIPSGEEGFYTEQIWRLPQRFCYAPPPYAPPPAQPARGVTFGSFNNLAKAGPAVLQLWAQILHAVPQARLLLKWQSLADPAIRAQWRQAFARHGIDPARLELRGASPHAQMLAEYNEIDIALDSFPFSGGLTSCEALWMGVPVITWPGALAISRQTQMILQSIGQHGLVAASAPDYVALAVALAHDTARRARLRQTLRPQIAASPLCDGPGFTRALEAAYRGMWQHYCLALAQTGR